MDPVTRRKFLSVGTLAIGGALVVGWAAPAVAYLLSPARKPEHASEWVALGSTAKVEVGTPALFKTRVVRTTAWETSEEEVAVYVVTEDGRNFAGLSNVCTHLGCRVRWVDDRDAFFCPCHNGVFSKTGEVLDGPPPRPLDPYALRIEDGQIFVDLEV